MGGVFWMPLQLHTPQGGGEIKIKIITITIIRITIIISAK